MDYAMTGQVSEISLNKWKDLAGHLF